MEAIHVLLFCITLILFSKFLRKSQTKNLPPGPKGLPIIGNLHQLGPRLHESLSAMAKEYGPLMTVQFGSITTVIASSAETAKEILHTNDQIFANRPVPDSITTQAHPEGTLAWIPGDQIWRNRRRICNTQMFTPQRLDYLQHFRHKKVHQLIAHINKHKGTPVDVGALAFATTLNLVSNTIFSLDTVDPDFETAPEFKNVMWTIMMDAGKPNISDNFPMLRWFDLQGVRRHVRGPYKRMYEIFEDIIGKRLKQRDTDKTTRHGDFLDVLLDQVQEEGSGFTIETIKPLIMDLFVAGSDTSGSTTEWAMAELLRNPRTLQKARDEVLQVIGSQGEIKESDIARLPYIDAVVKETLRLHPTAPLLLPYIAGDDVEISGYTIHKGNQVIVNAWSIGRNPKYWPNPLSFEPERFLGNKINYKGRDFEYIPFGAGRRICPGLPLAQRMVSLMLSSMLLSFNWKLPEGTTPENLDMTEQYGLTLKMANSLWAVPLAE